MMGQLTLKTLVDKKYRVARDSILIFVVSVLLFSLSVVQQHYFKHEQLFFFAQHALNKPLIPHFIYHHLHQNYSSRFMLVLPSAICSALTLVLIYLIAAPHSRKWGFCALLFAMSTYMFSFTARSLSMQPYLTLLITFSFYLLYAKEIYLFHLRVGWLVILSLLTYACAGLNGFMQLSIVILLYLALSDRRRAFIIYFVSNVLLGLIASAIAYLSNHPEVLCLSGKTYEATRQSIDFYFLHAFSWYTLSYPLAILVLLGIVSKKSFLQQSKHLALIKYSFAWALGLLIYLSIQPYKTLQDAVVIVPACALIAAYLFVDGEQALWINYIRRAIAWLFFISPFIAAIITLITRNLSRHRLHENFHTDFAVVFNILLLLQIVAIIYGLAKHRSRKESMGLLVATLTFMTVLIVVVEPALLLRSPIISV